MWWWGDPETYGGDCQEFRGGTGMTYPPHMDADGDPYVFVDNIYRKMKLQYLQQTAKIEATPSWCALTALRALRNPTQRGCTALSTEGWLWGSLSSSAARMLPQRCLPCRQDVAVTGLEQRFAPLSAPS